MFYIGIDPEGSALHFSISGPVFTVDRETGVVRLRQSLDRESHALVEVIISLTGNIYEYFTLFKYMQQTSCVF